MQKMKIEKLLGEFLLIKRKAERVNRAIEILSSRQGRESLKRERAELEKSRENAKIRLEKMIASLPSDEMRQLMKYKYLHGMTMEELAEVMFFSVRHCYRLNKKAIEFLSVDEHNKTPLE